MSTNSWDTFQDRQHGITAEVDQIDREMEQLQKERTRNQAKVLESLDEDFTFASYGLTEPLKITRGNQTDYIQLKIKSVGVAEILEITQKDAPRPPTQIKTYKRDTEIARQFGYKHDTVVREIDENHPDYAKAKQEYDAKVSQLILLKGLNYNLTWNGQIVLRGEDPNAPTEIVDMDAALKAIRKKGLSSNHFAIVVKNIRQLTEEAEGQDERD
mgnify:FL=1